VSLVLSNVRFSRRQLVTDGRISLTAIERVAATADVTSADLSTAAGRRVQVMSSGQVQVDVAGVEATVTPRLEGGSELVIEAGGFPVLDVDLARIPVLSACSFGLHASGGQLQLTCTVEPVPPSVVTAFSGATA
jgi:hypothetical protein